MVNKHEVKTEIETARRAFKLSRSRTFDDDDPNRLLFMVHSAESLRVAEVKLKEYSPEGNEEKEWMHDMLELVGMLQHFVYREICQFDGLEYPYAST